MKGFQFSLIPEQNGIEVGIIGQQARDKKVSKAGEGSWNVKLGKNSFEVFLCIEICFKMHLLFEFRHNTLHTSTLYYIFLKIMFFGHFPLFKDRRYSKLFKVWALLSRVRSWASLGLARVDRYMRASVYPCCASTIKCQRCHVVCPGAQSLH